MRAVAGKMLVAFERVVDDWAEGDPTVERRWASAEGVRADGDVCSPRPPDETPPPRAPGSRLGQVEGE
jgi:hypothetical protein